MGLFMSTVRLTQKPAAYLRHVPCLRWVKVVLSVVLLMAMAGASLGQTHTWKAVPADNNWFNSANWDGDGSYPGTADEVVVGAGAAITLTNETAVLASFTMTGGTLTFTNWLTRLRATTVDLQAGALALPAAFTSTVMSNRIWIVCQDLTLGATATINVDGKGYIAGTGPGGASTLQRRGGGGHGGRGGFGDSGGGGITNDAVHEPVNPGSGGAHAGAGGSGGGAVRIQATGTVDLQGTIYARGANNSVWTGGGGSGGSIWIECVQFAAGAGALLNADGGNGTTHGGGGGGGRIALTYDSLQGLPGLRFSTAPGVGWADSAGNIDTYGWFPGSGWGTVSLSDTGLVTQTLDNNRFQKANLYVPDLLTLSLNNLTVENCSVILAMPGLALSVAGNLTIGTNGYFGIGEYGGSSNAQLTVGNNLIVTNGGLFSVYSGPAVVALDDFGARVRVTNTMAVADGSWVYPHSHPVDGGSPLFVAGTLTVAAGGGFNAHARGYGAKLGPEPGNDSGSRGAGGGHGGRGGSSDAYFHAGGVVNGTVDRPMRPGSGGGSQAHGGGLIAVDADSAVISGMLKADGARGWGTGNLGGGAGGGIVIDCTTLSGQSARFQANGGNGSSGLGGGGGGGRIALHYTTINGLSDPQFSTAPGTGYSTGRETDSWWHQAGEGTLWCTSTNLLSATINSNRFTQVRFHANGFTTWTVSSLAISNSSICFGTDGFELNVTGNLTIGTNGSLGMGAISGDARPSLTCGGNLVVRNGGALHVFGGLTNGVDAALGATVEITGDLLVESGAWIYPYTHAGSGGSPRFRARKLEVAALGGFKAIGRGYPTQSGPGAGTFAGTWRGGGGGHGGWGGDGSSTARGGTTNGLLLATMFPGSGGGNLNGNNPPTGGSGGGVIWLELRGTAQVDGLLNADGTDARVNSGGGSGGGILINARRYAVGGTAVLNARGGKGQADHGGGGGGGRMVFWLGVEDNLKSWLIAGGDAEGLNVSTEAFDGFAGTVSVDFGFGYTGGLQDAEIGTIRYVDGRSAGTVIMFR